MDGLLLGAGAALLPGARGAEEPDHKIADPHAGDLSLLERDRRRPQNGPPMVEAKIHQRSQGVQRERLLQV